MKWKVKFGSSSLGKNLRFRVFGIIFEVQYHCGTFHFGQPKTPNCIADTNLVGHNTLRCSFQDH